VARSISLDQALVDYLESLCARAYFVIYGTRTRLVERMAAFFLHDWPQAVRALWRETLISALLGVIGTVGAYLLVSADPDWFYAFVPEGLAAGRDPTASAQFLRQTLYAPASAHQYLAPLASFLFTHNSQIAIFAFALGFALCLPTAALLVVNGGTLGAFLAVFAGRGLAFEAVGWLMIHGVTELFAITLAGAAGLSIGWAVAFPGERTRMDAAVDAGRRAATAMMGVVVMLFVAGLLEGFARQLVTNDLARYAIALTSAAVWGLYFYGPRRGRAP
jgi:uncharacterized membrane protein SpoIIM required for sporulation